MVTEMVTKAKQLVHYRELCDTADAVEATVRLFRKEASGGLGLTVGFDDPGGRAVGYWFSDIRWLDVHAKEALRWLRMNAVFNHDKESSHEDKQREP